jgi:UPF0755 protein
MAMAKTILLTDEERTAFIRKEKWGLLLIGAFMLVPMFLWCAATAYEFNRPFAISVPATVVIKPGSGFIAIADALADQHIVPNPVAFKMYLFLSGAAAHIRAGSYGFQGTQTIVVIAAKLQQGPDDIVATIPEGYTANDIDAKLSDLGLVPRGSLLTLSRQMEIFPYPFLQSESVQSLEGFLFPDTYRFAQQTAPDAVIRKMLDTFQTKVADNPELAPQLQGQDSVYNVIKLASLVEKEVTEDADRRMVAGILWERLERAMPLQVDASVIYAWRQINPDWKPVNKRLSAADLKIKSLYNTYQNKGLPPTPICNPGLDAIKAVLNPAQSEYLFYLSAPDGTTIFSKTLEEHNAAKKLYLK